MDFKFFFYLKAIEWSSEWRQGHVPEDDAETSVLCAALCSVQQIKKEDALHMATLDIEKLCVNYFLIGKNEK